MTASCAAECNHLEVLKWALNNRCPVSADACAMAARGGYFEMLKYLREKGCPWAGSTSGHLAVEAYLRR